MIQDRTGAREACRPGILGPAPSGWESRLISNQAKAAAGREPGSADILVVAGEPSGDLHMAGVVAEVHRQFPELNLRWFGSGGSALAAEGVETLLDVSELAAIGPGDALLKIRNYLWLFRRLQREARRRRPRLAVLVDFPEFNLRLAPRLKRMGIPVCGFIGPQVWAWRSSRLETIRRFFDRMLVIFPFEEEFYRAAGVAADFVGNPTAQLGRRARPAPPREPGTAAARVALMPGSREREIERILPVQLDAAASMHARMDCSFWLIAAPGVVDSDLSRIYRRWREKGRPALPLEIRRDSSWRLLPQCDCAIIKSGTSTLEAMVLGVPFAMVYRMSNLSYRLLRPWVKTDVYCLANLVAGQPIVPEFVQEEARGERVADYLCHLLAEPEAMSAVKQNLGIASERLGRRDAYPEAARRIVELLKDGAVT